VFERVGCEAWGIHGGATSILYTAEVDIDHGCEARPDQLEINDLSE
jgi:hypothetical protein